MNHFVFFCQSVKTVNCFIEKPCLTTKIDVPFVDFQFVAPEVVNFEAITFATDMWSVGVIAYVL